MEKRRYTSRLAAEAALSVARAQWRRNPSRAEKPPIRVYQCERCTGWHLTHVLTKGDGMKKGDGIVDA
jgi:ribosomal protein L32